MTNTKAAIAFFIIASFNFGFGVARIWDNYHQPHIVKPHVAHVGPYDSRDSTIVYWTECDQKEAEIWPPLGGLTFDARESDAVRQQRWNDAIRCLRVGHD